MNRQDQIYNEVTQDILSILEDGNLPPWTHTWKAGMHQNLISRKPYRGINQLALHARATRKGYQSSYWLTFHQCQELGGYVKKGEKSAIVVKWMWFKEQDQETGEAKEDGKVWAATKYFRVFNLDQTEGIDAPKETNQELQPVDRCETIVADMPNKPAIKHDDKTQAFYSPLRDFVNVPAIHFFESSEAYYAALFHELGHATGHVTRIGRKEVMETNFFGSHDYSKEELCAESCTAFLCAIVGIQTPRTITNTKAYIKGWLEALKNNRKLLIYGIQNGQKAADYILGIKPEYED